MPIYFFHWTEENIEHLDDNGVSPEEFEAVVQDMASERTSSRRSGRPAKIGIVEDGRRLFCVFEWLDENQGLIFPVTAYWIGNE